MTYDSLTFARKVFVDAAFSTFPNLDGTISRDQVNQVCQEHNLPFPAWLTHPTLRAGRAQFFIPTPTSVEPKMVETDEQISSRIQDTYESMKTLIEAVAANTVNSLVLSGAPGIGKSYTVEKTLQEVNSGDFGFSIHKGYIRASHLFRLLWENRNPGDVVVLDDTDAIFGDETALNILKAALELKRTRRIGWGSEKIFEDQDGEEIPRYFNFEGSVIFLTNLAIHDLINSNSKYAPHLSALESRSLVLDLGIRSKKEYMIKIAQTVQDGMLRDKGFSKSQESEIMEFINENMDRFRELSLRMVEKVAALYNANPTEWKKLVKAVCMR